MPEAAASDADRPAIRHLIVHGFESYSNLLIENRSQQAALTGIRLRPDICADKTV